jgi:hypothetical protein
MAQCAAITCLAIVALVIVFAAEQRAIPRPVYPLGIGAAAGRRVSWVPLTNWKRSI